ncbi:hypothetical protein L6R52_32420 [Myxococcota bacterium]|nr:hypothetical protein [Myxococcota bacterium]
MTERVRAQSTSTRDGIRETLGFAVTTGAVALSAGAAAVPTALARGWLAKKGVDVAADTLSKVLRK